MDATAGVGCVFIVRNMRGLLWFHGVEVSEEGEGMCGLTGMLWGVANGVARKREQLAGAIHPPAVALRTHRGPYATGAAWVKTDGNLSGGEGAAAGRGQFVYHGNATPASLKWRWIDGVDDAAGAYALALARSVRNPEDNHPICAPPILADPTMEP